MKCWQDAFREGAPGCEQKCCPRLERHECRRCSGASSGRKEPGCNLSRCSRWKSKIWRIYLFLVAKAARLIFPSVDGFSGCATGSLKLVQISAACPASNFSEFPAANSPLLLAVSAHSSRLLAAIQTETPLLACRAPKQTTSLYWTSEPQLNPTLWFGHCAPDACSLFWLRRGWMNSTVESEQAQPLPFQSCGLRKKKKKNNTYVSAALKHLLISSFSRILRQTLKLFLPWSFPVERIFQMLLKGKQGLVTFNCE